MTAMAISCNQWWRQCCTDGSAILEVKSTTKGFLLHHVWQRNNAITEPVAGLQIWCTDCGDTGRYVFYTMEGGLLEELESLQSSNCNYR
jgi:hypothetical protein